jgi:DnaJ-class molecular chaperone
VVTAPKGATDQCVECGGTGRAIDSGMPCLECRGKGLVSR